MLRIGVVQSTSSVDFFGIEIVGHCAIVVEFTSDGSGQWGDAAAVLRRASGCVESKLHDLTLTYIRRGAELPMSFINGLLAGSLLAGGVCPRKFSPYWELTKRVATDLLLVLLWYS